MAELPFPESLVYQSWGQRVLNNKVDYHKGVDFGRGAANVAGTPVPCVAEGVVTAVGSHPDYQHYVQIEHARDSAGRRWWTRHHMMSNRDLPANGQKVTAGTIIGRVAPPGGVTTGVHHHFEVHTDDAAYHTPNYLTSVDPEDYIQLVPVRGTDVPTPTPIPEEEDMKPILVSTPQPSNPNLDDWWVIDLREGAYWHIDNEQQLQFARNTEQVKTVTGKQAPGILAGLRRL